MDTITLVETKRAEMAKRVARLRSQLDTAEAELRKYEITAETLKGLGLNPDVDTTVPRGQSYNCVLGVLSDTESDAMSPKEVHDALVAEGITSISQDNVRTILSRHKDRFYNSDGRYWRKAEKEIEPPIDQPEGGSKNPNHRETSE